ncbi:hypothetical protein [Streptomyces sp. NPDC003480]
MHAKSDHEDKALPLRYHPDTPLLGPVLAITAHGRRLPVPAGAATDAIAPAAARLLDKLPPDELPAAEERLQEATVARLAQLLGLDHIPARPEPVCRLSSPTHRYDIAVVSAITTGTLGPRVEEGRAALAETPPGRGRLVVYGGPRFLGPELISDIAFLHVEEVGEILHHCTGDVTLLALFVLELTEHPGARAVAYEDALDAWSQWHREATLLLPGTDRQGVTIASTADHDEVWERAATHAETDHLLTAAGLPSLQDFLRSRRTPLDPGSAGTYTDLEHHTADGSLLIRTATVPPLVIVAVPSQRPSVTRREHPSQPRRLPAHHPHHPRTGHRARDAPRRCAPHRRSDRLRPAPPNPRRRTGRRGRRRRGGAAPAARRG